jgi:hypothetical protein
MAEASFPGVAQFSDGGLFVAALSATYFPCYRLVITDDTIRLEGRWRLLRAVLPSRSRRLDEVVSARLRGTFLIISLPRDEWWTLSAGRRSTRIMKQFESRGIQTVRDSPR